VEVEGEALGGGERAHEVFGVADRGAQGERLRMQDEVAGLDGAEIEQVVDEAEQEAALRVDGGGVTRGSGCRAEEFGAAENGLERSAEFVAEEGEELRLGAVGLLDADELLDAALLGGAAPREDRDGIEVGGGTGRRRRRARRTWK